MHYVSKVKQFKQESTDKQTDKRTNGQTDRQTDATKRIISPATRSIMTSYSCMFIYLYLTIMMSHQYRRLRCDAQKKKIKGKCAIDIEHNHSVQDKKQVFLLIALFSLNFLFLSNTPQSSVLTAGDYWKIDMGFCVFSEEKQLKEPFMSCTRFLSFVFWCYTNNYECGPLSVPVTL